MSLVSPVESLRHNLKFGLRAIRRNPGFSVAVVLTIALGIGANTAMFSVIRAVLLRSLPYRDPDRIVLVAGGATPVRAEEIASASRSYTETGAFTGFEDLALSGMGEPEVLKGVRVSANFLSILGVVPLRGRSSLPEDDRPGSAPVAMISAELWRRRFGRDPAVVGNMATLAGVPTTIIGVLPAGFQFPTSGVDVWLTRPSEWSVLDPKARPLSPFLSIFGRLKPQVGAAQATAELAVLDRQYAIAHPGMLDSKPDSPEVVLPIGEDLVSDVRPKLWMLFGAVAFVLLIVCANIGGLLLARATTRAREFAVQAAIGAGRGRIVGQLLTETLLLAVLGGSLGISLAAGSLSAIRQLTLADLPRAQEIQMDPLVLGFGIALTLLTGIVCGLVPAAIASRPDLALVLKGSGEATAGARVKMIRKFGARGFLVVGQVALSMILLIGASLLIESLAHLYRVDPGFQSSGLLTMKIALSPAQYDTKAKRAMFYDQLRKRLSAQSGVVSAAVSLTLPMSDGWMGTTLELTGREPRPLNERPIAIFENITPGYFRTMRISLARGRDFNDHDDLAAPQVAIISESAAHVLWPQYPQGPDPIGEHILFGSDLKPSEIVGIAADVHQTGKDSDPRPGIYVPCLQNPPSSAALAVRTVGSPLAMAAVVRRQVLAIDPAQPVSDISTMDEVVDTSEGQLRLMMTLLGSFASVATVLAMIGLYGVVSYSVVQRTGEIGIRRALGAPSGNILSLVARQVVTLALTGILLGIGGALLLTRLLQDMLFQVKATDLATFAGAAILFMLVALGASYMPARRAARIDPLRAIRTG